MDRENGLLKKIKDGSFVLTAEYLPRADTKGVTAEALGRLFGKRFDAVNAADNPFGTAVSSLAASVGLLGAGIEPVLQTVTRDRNRIALVSDLLGAAALGVRNVLCLSGYHQSLSRSPGAANVYDIDSIQLVAAVTRMRNEGVLPDGSPIDGGFPMTAGAAANPFLRPPELNLIRLAKKAAAGAEFLQTHAVFDLDAFFGWLAAAREKGITSRTALIAGVLPLDGAAEAEYLRSTWTDFFIPDAVVERLRAAGDEAAQRKEGLVLFGETVRALRGMDGVRGIHLLSGGKEERIPEFIAAAGLG